MSKNKKQPVQTKNPLEALKECAASVANSAVKDVAGGIASASLDQLFGWGSADNQPPQYGQYSPEQLPQKEQPAWLNPEVQPIHQESLVLYKREEQEIRVKIEAIREELKKLTLETRKIAKEVQVAALQAPVDANLYNLSFLEKLRQTIIFLRKRITESRNWLAMANGRTKKRSFYWAQVRKSGTKFMLSAERAIATQSG